jgi:tetratricopeptide (TPR) repeat protein
MQRSFIAVLALTAGTAIFVVSALELQEARAIQSAQEHLGWGRLEQAEEVLTRAVALVPTSPVLRQERSLVLAALGRWRDDPVAAEEAHLELAAATALNPLDGMAWGEYGESLRRAGRPEQAEAAVRRGLVRDPHNVYLLGLLGQAQLDAGRPADAVTSFERAQAVRHNRVIGELLEQARAAARAETVESEAEP